MQLFFIVIVSLGLMACASTEPPSKGSAVYTEYAVDMLETELVKERLLEQHQHWKGTPYKYGGTSRTGIDCSGFIYRTYKDQLGIVLPRTTADQSKLGEAVTRAELTEGDLVFFKTSTKVRHVGIYLGDDKFMHASSSKGVMISLLSNPYWSPRYWMARRVTDPYRQTTAE